MSNAPQTEDVRTSPWSLLTLHPPPTLATAASLLPSLGALSPQQLFFLSTPPLRGFLPHILLLPGSFPRLILAAIPTGLKMHSGNIIDPNEGGLLLAPASWIPSNKKRKAYIVRESVCSCWSSLTRSK